MSGTRINAAVALRPIQDAVSASWLYPFKGIWYFFAHPMFYPLFGRRLLPLLVLSFLVLGTLFTFAYLPQVAFLAIFHGALAWFNALFLVLGEGQVIVALLFEAFFVDESLVNVFDATLIKEGCVDLVSPSRLLDHGARNEVKMLGKPTTPAIYSPFSFQQIAEFVLLLPLNLIPLVGTPVFLVLTGARAGPFHHWRYFKLLGLSRNERNQEIKSRRWKYTWFGTVALLLQLIPVLSMFFLLTTAAGSALWVAKLEKQKELIDAAPVVNVTEENEVPDYTDNPV